MSGPVDLDKLEKLVFGRPIVPEEDLREWRNTMRRLIDEVRLLRIKVELTNDLQKDLRLVEQECERRGRLLTKYHGEFWNDRQGGL